MPGRRWAVTGMRIVVFGASGPTGRHILAQARACGNEVVAVTRRPESIPRHERVRVVQVDATDPQGVESVVVGADAVLSALGVPFGRAAIDLYSSGTANILRAMRVHAVRRLVVVSAAPLDPDYRASEGWLFTRVFEPLFIRVPGRTTYEDLARMEGLVASSDRDWTIVRSSWLFETDEVSDYQLTTGTPHGMYTARPDLAAAMLALLDDRRSRNTIVSVNTTTGTPRLSTQIWRENIRGTLRG